MVITWSDFRGVLLETFILANFLLKNRICFFKVKHYFGHISGMVGPIDVKRKGSVSVGSWVQYVQCSAKALEKWGQMTHTIEKYGGIGNFSGATSVILPFTNLKHVGTLVPTAKIIGDIPDFNVLNVLKTQPRHNPVCDLDLWPYSWPWPWMFQGQISKLLYLRNCWSDWCEMKMKWVNMILGRLYDLALWPHPWPWPWSWNFKVKVSNSSISGMGRLINMERKVCESSIHDHDID